MDLSNSNALTPEQIEGIKQFEKDRAELIIRVMAKYKLVNGKWVKIELDKKKEIVIFVKH